jgi:hypothetical protein
MIAVRGARGAIIWATGIGHDPESCDLPGRRVQHA